MSQYIKNLINTKGWKEIEKMIDEAILECKNMPIPDSMPAEEYKITAIGNNRASQKLKLLLNKIKLAGGTFHNDKERYI